MKRAKALAVLLQSLLLCTSAVAQTPVSPSDDVVAFVSDADRLLTVNPSSGAPYTGPGDVVTFSSWYSCVRAYSASAASAGKKACRLNNNGNTEQCDVVDMTSGNVATTVSNCTGSSSGNAISTFCSSPCSFAIAYDQVGSNDVVQATQSAQPVYQTSCLSTFACAKVTSASFFMQAAANTTPATGVVSLALVANRSAGTGASQFIGENSFTTDGVEGGTANHWSVRGGAGSNFAVTANDAAWHAGVAVVNGASSVLNVDGTETTGTANGSTTAGKTGFQGGVGSTTANVTEAGFIDNVALTGTQRTNLCKNMQAYYGSGNFGAGC